MSLLAVITLLGCSRVVTPSDPSPASTNGETDGVLPAAPSDLEVERAALFEERLVPLGGTTTADENAALSEALRTALGRRDPYNTDEIEGFLRDHPNSPWRASLLTNLGIVWRETGRYSQALDAWETAWSLTRADISWRGHATADRAVSEFALLNAQLGRRDRLTALFGELSGRPPTGSAAERLGRAQLGWATMEVHPEVSYRCGPFAVRNVWGALRPHETAPSVLTGATSTANGTSLAQLTELAAQSGEPMRAMFRGTGTGFVVPSVVHWRVNHFAALIAVEEPSPGERVYVLRDPTFGRDVRTTERWLESETSGYLLVPTRLQSPASWREVLADEASTVWGRGETSGLDPDAFGDGDLFGGQCNANRGMAAYGFHTQAAALHVADAPVWLNPAFGPAVHLNVAYNQADWSQPQLPQSTWFGSRWTHNWASFIDGTISNNTLALHMGGGGIVRHYRVGGTWQPEERTGDILQPSTGSLPTTIQLTKRSGAIETYTLLASGFAPRWYLTQTRDPQGNAVNLAYDSDRRLLTVTDATLGTLTFSYRSNDPMNEGYYLVSQVTVPDGRYATFNYKPYGVSWSLILSSISDMGGITSYFGYSQVARGQETNVVTHTVVPDPTFLSYLYTPYGTTTFTTGWGTVNAGGYSGRYLQRWVEVQLPTGEGERIEARTISNPSLDCQGLVPCAFTSTDADLYPATWKSALLAERIRQGLSYSVSDRALNLNFRNSYYWNRTGYARGRTVGGGGVTFDPRHAHVSHWLHPVEGNEASSPILESEVPPGESRIHYLYDRQSSPQFLRPAAYDHHPVRPVVVARLLAPTGPASSEDATQIIYDYQGNPHEITDSSGRTRCLTWHDYTTDLWAVHAGPCPGGVGAGNAGVANTAASRLLRVDYANHRPVQVIDAAGQTTSYGYNVRGQLLRETHPDGKSTDYVYSSPSTLMAGGLAVPSPTEGRLLQIRFPVGVSGVPLSTTAISYHPNGTVQSVTDREGVQRTYTYDPLERVTSVAAPGSRTVYYDYTIRDATGASMGVLGLEATRITHPNGDTQTLAYDAVHRVIYSARGSSDVVRYRYNQTAVDGFDIGQRLAGYDETVLTRWTAPPTPVPAMGTFVGPPESAFQQRTSTRTRQGTYPSEVTAWTYDVVGRRVTGSDISTLWSAAYRPNGLPLRICEGPDCTATSTAPRTVFTYEPSALGRLTQVQHFTGTTTTDFTRVIGYVPTGSLGALQPQSVSDSAVGDASASTVTYTYDVLGRRSSATIPTVPAETLTWIYDSNDRLQRLTSNLTAQDLLRRYYYPNSPTRRIDTDDMPAYGCRAVMTQAGVDHDFRDQDRLVFNTTTQAQLSHSSFQFDLNDRLQQETNNSVTRSYAYYADGRAMWVDDYPITGGPLYRNFYYDPNGNSTGTDMFTSAGTFFSESASFDLLDRFIYRWTPAVGGFNPVQDIAGHVTNDGEYRYEWDQNDHLKRVVRNSDNVAWQFRYDPHGRLRRFEEGGQWHRLVWVNDELRQEYVGPSEYSQPTLWRSYSVDGFTQNGNRYRYERDVRGSVRSLLRNGQVSRAWTYDPWGKRLGDGGSEFPLESRFGYAGYLLHFDTGLNFTPARVYSPTLRRWLSRDPLGERHSIDGNNLYGYAANDPVNYVDSTGRNPIAIFLGGALAGGIVGAIAGGFYGGLSGSCGSWQAGALRGAASGFVSGAVTGGLGAIGFGGAFTWAVSGAIGGAAGATTGEAIDLLGPNYGYDGAFDPAAPFLGAAAGALSGGISGWGTHGHENAVRAGIAGFAGEAIGGSTTAFVEMLWAGLGRPAWATPPPPP